MYHLESGTLILARCSYLKGWLKAFRCDGDDSVLPIIQLLTFQNFTSQNCKGGRLDAQLRLPEVDGCGLLLVFVELFQTAIIT